MQLYFEEVLTRLQVIPRVYLIRIQRLYRFALNQLWWILWIIIDIRLGNGDLR